MTEKLSQCPLEDQERLIRERFKHLSPEELDLLIYTARRTGLDPLAKQIQVGAAYDKDKGRKVMQLTIGIDGFRLIAERTKRYRGQVGPWWCAKDGKWLEVWTSNDLPVAARVGVIRDDFRETLYRVARFASYSQTTKGSDGKQRLNRFWSRMPDVMIAKCAEALALRAAFPQELSGLYTPEELGETDGTDGDPPAKPGTSPAARTAADQAEALAKRKTALASEHKRILGWAKTPDVFGADSPTPEAVLAEAKASFPGNPETALKAWEAGLKAILDSLSIEEVVGCLQGSGGKIEKLHRDLTDAVEAALHQGDPPEDSYNDPTDAGNAPPISDDEVPF